MDYKLGDRVALTVQYDDLEPGTLGTVTQFTGDDKFPLRVMFDVPFEADDDYEELIDVLKILGSEYDLGALVTLNEINKVED